MSQDEAIRPTFSSNTDDEVEEINQDEEMFVEETESLAALAHHLGFQTIRDEIESRAKEYRSGVEMKIDGNEDFEAIGRKYLVSSLVASELEGVLAMIDTAVDAVESNGK